MTNASTDRKYQRGEIEVIILILVAFLAVAFWLGGLSERDGWHSDCKHLSKHLSQGKVYECRVIAQ